MNIRFLAVCSLSLVLQFTVRASAGNAGPSCPLPELSTRGAWKAGVGNSTTKVSEVDGLLCVEFDPAKGNQAEQLLVKPLEVPGWAEDFTFVCSADPRPSQMMVDVILADAEGQRWFAKAKVPGTSAYHKNLGVINTGQLRGKPERLTVPALGGPDVRDFRGEGAPFTVPSRPWKVLGFRFGGDRQPHHKPEPSLLYLGKFAFTSIRHGNSEYSGIYGDREFYVETDGKPGIRAAEFYSSPGVYQLTWQIYSDYAGRPVREGSARFDLGDKASTKPLALQLAEAAPLPEMPKGTSWVRWRARRLATGESLFLANEIIEKEQRLYVASSRVDGPAKASPAKANPDGNWLEISPEAPGYISSPGQPFGLKVTCRKPPGFSGDAVLNVTARTPNLRTEKKKMAIPVIWGEGSSKEIGVDFADLPAGAYRVEVEMTVSAGVVDRTSCLIGRKEALDAKDFTALKRLPKGVADWKTALNRPEPFFHLSPMVHSVTAGFKDKNNWDWLNNFLEQAPAVSRDSEYHFPWKMIEPLPGVFDWEEMNLFLRKSESLGLHVLIVPEFWGQEPEWLPTIPSMNMDGRIFFDFAYNFHNARQNYAQSPFLRKTLGDAIGRVVTHVKDDPAAEAYFLIQELPADAGFMNWKEGYDELTISNYRKQLRDRFENAKALSAHWGRQVGKIDAVQPPSPGASARERLDWLRFRADSNDEMMEMLIGKVREQDKLRLIFVYGDTFGTKLTNKKMLEQGCALGNGGSHGAMHPFAVSMDGLDGMVVRTEDHWPGKWTGYFPEVLDASVFAMSYGGGKAMNCHHFMFTYLPELGKDKFFKFSDLRKHPYSLDRYEKFQPIWTALRKTERMPVEVLQLLDTEAGLLENGILSRNGLWDGSAQLACYRSHINFGANELPGATKARLLLMTKDHLDTLTREKINSLKTYVKEGGQILMLPAAGRGCVEQPGEDWVLLREFGFMPPASSEPAKGSFAAVPEPGNGFGQALAPFNLGGRFDHSLTDGEQLVARFKQFPEQASLTWKAFGRGRVAVLWGSNLPARGDGTMDGLDGNVLGAAAEWAGIEPVMAASSPFFWLNLLRSPSGKEYFGLAHLGQWARRPDKGVAGDVKYRLDLRANYRVTELITGKELGTISGQDLWQKGLPLELTPRQVAIFRFSEL